MGRKIENPGKIIGGVVDEGWQDAGLAREKRKCDASIAKQKKRKAKIAGMGAKIGALFPAPFTAEIEVGDEREGVNEAGDIDNIEVANKEKASDEERNGG